MCNYSNHHQGRSASQKNRKRELDLVVREAGGGLSLGPPKPPGSLGDLLPCRAGHWDTDFPCLRERVLIILGNTQHLLQNGILLGLGKGREVPVQVLAKQSPSDREAGPVAAVVHSSEPPVQSQGVLCSLSGSVGLSPRRYAIQDILVTLSRVTQLAICPCRRSQDEKLCSDHGR